VTFAEQESLVPSVRVAVASRRRKRMWRRLVDLLQFVLALSLAYGIYSFWVADFWAWQGNIQTSGHRLVSRADVLARLFVPPNRALYRLDPEWIQAQLSVIPAIERVEVRRWLFPARISIKIQERRPMLRVQSVRGGGAFFLDHHGVVFGAAAVPLTPRFALKAIMMEGPGERVTEADARSLRALLAAWPAGVSGRLDLRRWNDVYVQIGEWPVRLGRLEAVELKLGLLQYLQPAVKRYRERLKYLDFRYVESPSIVLKSGDRLITEQAKAKPSPSASPPIVKMSPTP